MFLLLYRYDLDHCLVCGTYLLNEVVVEQLFPFNSCILLPGEVERRFLLSSICKTGGMVLGTDSGSWEEEADVSPTISMSSLDMSVDLPEPWVLDMSL